MNLTERARQRLATPKAQPDLPSWMPLASNVLLGLVLVAFTVQAIFAGDADVPAPRTQPEAGVDGYQEPLGATLDGHTEPTSPHPASTVDSGTLELYRIDGSPVSIPADAAGVVRDGVLGRLTGNTAGVPSAPGTEPGRSAGRPDAVFAGYGNVLSYAQNSTLQLDVSIDPDGDGPESVQLYTGEVQFHAGSWKFVW